MTAPMLSRIAESLFWTGRYIERADDTARILDASLTAMLEDPWGDEDTACRSLLSVMGVPLPGEAVALTQRAVLDTLAYDPVSPSSIIGAFGAARDNAHGAREIVSSELWEALNGAWNLLPAQRRAGEAIGPARFFAFVKDRSALLAGIVDSTMNRDDGYRFLVLGRSLERVDMASRLLAVRLFTPGRAVSEPAAWLSILRALGADDGFLRAVRGERSAALIVQFLLLDRLFPRSIFHALQTAEQCLRELDPDSSRLGIADPARRTVGRARTGLEYADTDDLLTELPDHLDRLQRACQEATAAVAARYFESSMPVVWNHEEG